MSYFVTRKDLSGVFVRFVHAENKYGFWQIQYQIGCSIRACVCVAFGAGGMKLEQNSFCKYNLANISLLFFSL
jgi:hypothetical protein